ncbi:unnamed protein product [Leuciscus chuanchicus]
MAFRSMNPHGQTHCRRLINTDETHQGPTGHLMSSEKNVPETRLISSYGQKPPGLLGNNRQKVLIEAMAPALPELSVQCPLEHEPGIPARIRIGKSFSRFRELVETAAWDWTITSPLRHRRRARGKALRPRV